MHTLSSSCAAIEWKDHECNGCQRERSVTDSARDFHAADPGSNPGGGNDSHAIFVL